VAGVAAFLNAGILRMSAAFLMGGIATSAVSATDAIRRSSETTSDESFYFER
jgi:hypothetical protein